MTSMAFARGAQMYQVMSPNMPGLIQKNMCNMGEVNLPNCQGTGFCPMGSMDMNVHTGMHVAPMNNGMAPIAVFMDPQGNIITTMSMPMNVAPSQSDGSAWSSQQMAWSDYGWCNWSTESEHSETIPETKPKDDLLKLSLDRLGCWKVQAMIPKFTNAELEDLAQQLKGHVRELIESPHGNHVMQKFIEYASPHRLGFVLRELIAWAPAHFLAQHRFGCRVLERILEHFPEEPIAGMLKSLVDHTEELMVHRYGNYVIRVLAEQGPEQAKAAVHNTLRKHLVRLARNDKGCTLVDVLLSYGEVTERKPIVQELIKVKGLVPSMQRLRSATDALWRILQIAEEMPAANLLLQRQMDIWCRKWQQQ
ncbi:unnamed protein product [Effrenium voratum]|uniref:PUM-HD domain-containing protein n=1 Tax=Effrenium voratum TaxID=2562239 RepID=A0AA36NFU7_9DINO|nr:unnamed protein product [Effrenium voratum]CAJ1400538.1 unnamed protein product [Effrenium voratum]